MTTHVFVEPAEWSFDKLGHRGKLFGSSGRLTSSSHLIIEITGRVPARLLQQECDFVYYVIEGRGTFHIEDRCEHCNPGDLVTIPKGSKFTYEGDGLRMLLTSTPPWWPGQEQVFDAE
ncbi:AraC family ligand binding domain-containing protein [Nonomuraea sp. NPDC050786]|uniref:AraC family ligand binding domain-containing protein n=1 Tax=Nonomuraea sp. NPDC050786 TaxID=3154840 RepID=UPI0033E40DFE